MVARRGSAMAKNKEPSESFSSEDEGSDDAPEEVTFESARVAAEEARRLAGERARREKTALKEKRRQREELFKEQKKKKLLPENVLEELASSAQNSNKKPSDISEHDQSIEDESESVREDNVMEDNEEETLAVRLEQSYMAVQLKDEGLANKQQQAARDFIQRQLYGGGSNRTTANKYFSLENKKGAVKKAAVQFVVNSWGKKKKQKAKEFTKRWISSEMIPTE
ncbi:nucleolar protein 7 [Eublepharis macularius]|uniref:Nucleolar protein 7 n=1 Tax=Eublepharis macularius TaxID=481883 RepID=A0AA97JL72_EUBMA|nr:nucleolar protein 7 [Eublepharis macularius]